MTASSSSPLQPSTTYRAILGRVLARRREQLGFDQGAFAKAVGLTSQSSWSRIETGASNISIEQLKLACNALHTRPDVVLSETEQVADNLQSRGVTVVLSADNPNADAVAFLGAAALGALIAAIFSK